MRHNFDPRAHFSKLYRAREILQDHPPLRPGEAIPKRLHVLATAAANVHEKHTTVVIVIVTAREASVPIEDLLLHGEPVGEDRTILATGRHKNVKVSGGFGLLFDEVPHVQVGVEGILEGGGEGIRRAMIAVFLKVGGHLGEELEGVVEAGGEFGYVSEISPMATPIYSLET